MEGSGFIGDGVGIGSTADPLPELRHGGGLGSPGRTEVETGVLGVITMPDSNSAFRSTWIEENQTGRSWGTFASFFLRVPTFTSPNLPKLESPGVVLDRQETQPLFSGS